MCKTKHYFRKLIYATRGGASYRPSLKWLAHKTFKLKLGYYSTGYKYERCLINCQSFTKNVAY